MCSVFFRVFFFACFEFLIIILFFFLFFSETECHGLLCFLLHSLAIISFALPLRRERRGKLRFFFLLFTEKVAEGVALSLEREMLGFERERQGAVKRTEKKQKQDQKKKKKKKEEEEREPRLLLQRQWPQ